MKGSGNRACGSGGQGACFGQRVAANGLEIGCLEFVLPGNPFAPCVFERFAKHPFELARVYKGLSKMQIDGKSLRAADRKHMQPTWKSIRVPWETSPRAL